MVAFEYSSYVNDLFSLVFHNVSFIFMLHVSIKKTLLRKHPRDQKRRMLVGGCRLWEWFLCVVVNDLCLQFAT